MSIEPVCLRDFENYARIYLPRNVFTYYFDGSCDDTTVKDNQDAFQRLRLRPRVLRDVSHLDTSTSLLGVSVSSPIGLSPTAVHTAAHPDGELASAKAAQTLGLCMIQSTYSSYSIEEVSAVTPGSLKWFQVYIIKERSETQQMIERAEKAGYKAVVVTIDSPFVQNKRTYQRGAEDFLRVIRVRGFPNFTDFHMLRRKYPPYHGTEGYIEANLCWSDIKWLCSITKLPIVLKGILTAEDALLAIEYGASAIIVSNHGGRQLDGVPATIDVLAEVVEAVNGRVEVYLDGGIRQGTDVLKALALGANAVFVGRPVIWGLAYAGEEGVKKVLQILQEEFRTAMALSGCSTIPEIRSSSGLVVREEFYHKL